MVYKLNVTDHADELLDNLVYHLIYRLKNKEAAKHLLDSVESIYDRLVENPYQFRKVGICIWQKKDIMRRLFHK